MAAKIEICDYDPRWPSWFELLDARVWPVVAAVAVRIDHVGSTSVPGLAAKPIIDLDVVVQRPEDVRAAIKLLERAGYTWDGDLGVVGREALSAPAGLEEPPHHLYVVVHDNRAHADHVLLRDLLRGDPAACRTYAAVKRQCAERAGVDVDLYTALKAGVVADLLTRARRDRGLPPVSYWEPGLPEGSRA